VGSLRQDLAGPGVEVVETHVSWVFLGEREVFKVKKPVALGFLDFSTREARRRACEAEVALNRRLAPGVYLGVVPVTRDGAGRHRLAMPGETVPSPPDMGEAVDWAVRMRRLPDAVRADHLLAAGRLTPAHLERLADRLAAFHAAARADAETACYGTAEAIAGNVRENFRQTAATVGRYLDPAQAAEVEGWQLDFLARRGELFAARVAAGRVRDGHGDLRLEHVYLDPPGGAGGGPQAADSGGGVTVIDCIEFNERFRYADVAADVSFLSMDLAWRGRVDLAERFLALYARAADDFDLYPLVDFYESYRACVRAKVSSFLAAEEGADAGARERADAEARRYYLLALAAVRRPLLGPAVVAVGGLLAAGKSTIAGEIAAALSAPVLDADRTRKRLVGVEDTAPLHVPPWQGPYAPEWSDRVYAELARRAAAVLASGRAVVVDASFHSRERRRALRRLAAGRGVPFHFVECRAAPELCRERLRRRAAGGVSDGRLEIFDDFVAGWEAVTELPAGEHLILDTSLPLAESLAVLRRALPLWPPGLTE
jgi:uncharacterized protein